MSDQQNPLRLPTRQAIRGTSISIRLTVRERAMIAALARYQQIPDSQLVRTLIVQAVEYYVRRLAIKVESQENGDGRPEPDSTIASN